MHEPHISPGLLTPSVAESLAEMMRQVEIDRRTIAEMAVTSLDEFPAALSAYDSATGRCSWTEQAYNASGLRYTKPAGRTGTATFQPAYPVGNGLMPPPYFPVEVWMRRRLISGTLGPVYEFDWVCGCGGSGSGSGDGGTVATACCPSRFLPTTLYATIAPSSPCDLGGESFELTHLATSWSRTNPTCGLPIIFSCTDGPSWRLSVGNGACLAVDTVLASSVPCSPLSVTFSLTIPAECTSCDSRCANTTLTITVTE